MLITTWLACRPDLELTDLGEAGAHGRHLAVPDQDEPVWVECTSPDDPEEQHLAEAPASSPAEVELFGLLADTEYTCVAHARRAEGEVTFRTAPLPERVEWTVTGQTTGYTLFNTQSGVLSDDENHAWVLVIDPEGQVRWSYDVGVDLICDIDAQHHPATGPDDPEGFHVGGGWASFSKNQSNRGVFLDLDLAGRVVLERTMTGEGRGFNHHSERLADGSTLSLLGGINAVGDHSWIGVEVEWWSPAAGVTWSWTSQTLVDRGVLAEPQGDTRAPYTANAVAVVEDPWGSAAWVSAYTKRELWRIDRDTGDRTHLIPDEFTVWDTRGVPLPPESFTYDQHDPEWSDGPFGPDTRVLMYDNGNGRPGGSFSRVVEFDVDLDQRRLVELWDWTEPGWWNPTLGDADRLEDGHVLVAKGFNLSRSEGSDDVAALVELDAPIVGGDEDPPAAVETWRVAWEDQTWNLYRAERIGPCDLFDNARYCEDTGRRLSELR
ncbi:MAG: aryl-sulfate sulfotransferase [Myxococcota bacterium]